MTKSTPPPAAPLGRTGAELIAHTLKGYGVSHVFFMESTMRNTLITMESLGIQRVLAHSEAAAVYMADGYARIARHPGVCMSQSVGAANIAAACQDPFLGRSPVLAITGKKEPSAQHRNAYQEIPHGPLFEPVTKFSAAVETFEQLPRLLRQALREATSGCPGPVHLDMAGGFGGQVIENASGPVPVIIEEPFTRYPAHRPAPEAESVRKAAAILEKAERPVIVAGGGVRLSGAGAEVVRLAEKLSAPIAATLSAKGVIPENHPLYVGVVGTYSRTSANRTVHEADVVLFIGSATGDQVTTAWTIPGQQAAVIQIDISQNELGRNYPNAASIHGDAKVSAAMLTEVLGKRVPNAPQNTSWTGRFQGFIQEWNAKYAALRASDASPIRPERLCAEIEKALPENGILVADTGFSGIWTGTLIEVTKPGQEYVRAAGSLGWGFPASLGVKCAAKDRPVIAYVGDGAFWYHQSEMETALRCGINTVTVINNNSSFGQCIDPVRNSYGGRQGAPEDLFRFTPTNFAQLANDMGCIGVRITDPADIGKALAEGLKADRPVILDVVTDPDARAPAPWTVKA